MDFENRTAAFVLRCVEIFHFRNFYNKKRDLDPDAEMEEDRGERRRDDTIESSINHKCTDN